MSGEDGVAKEIENGVEKLGMCIHSNALMGGIRIDGRAENPGPNDNKKHEGKPGGKTR